MKTYLTKKDRKVKEYASLKDLYIDNMNNILNVQISIKNISSGRGAILGSIYKLRGQ